MPSNTAEIQAFFRAVLALTGNQSVSVTIRDFVPVAPSFDDATGDDITGTVGTAIASVTVPAANGNPTPTYAVVGTLPAGVSFGPATRRLSFAENSIQAGSGTITIRATNSAGMADWTASYTFVAANAPPTASITTQPRTVDAGATVNLAATDADSDGTIASRAWTATGGTFANAAIRNAVWTAPAGRTAADTVYTLTYEVTDDDGATASAMVQITVRGQPLTLADWMQPDGTKVEMLALIQAGPATEFFYADAGSGQPVSGSVLAGNLELLDTTISSISRHNSNAQFRLRDRPDPENLGDLFASGGELEDSTMYLQTLAGGVQSFVSADEREIGGGHFQNFSPPTAFSALLGTIANATRFIIATTTPAALTLEGAVVAGTPAVEGNLAAPQFAGAVAAGTPTAIGRLGAPTLQGRVAAGEPGAQASLAPAQLAGRVSAGIPIVFGSMDTKSLRGRVSAGVPTVEGNMQHGTRLLGEVSAGIPEVVADLAPPQLAGAVSAGEPGAEADLVPAQLVGAVSAGEPGAMANMGAPPLRGEVSAGVPTVEASGLRPPQLAGAVSAGTPFVYGDMARALALIGHVSAGVPTVRGNLALGSLVLSGDVTPTPVTPGESDGLPGYEELPTLPFHQILEGLGKSGTPPPEDMVPWRRGRGR